MQPGQQAAHLEENSLFIKCQPDRPCGKAVGGMERIHRSYRLFGGAGSTNCRNFHRYEAQKCFITGLRAFHRQSFGQFMAQFVSRIAATDNFIGNRLDRVNRQVVDLYRLIRLWDVAELSNKCSDFLTGKGCKVGKRRNSSLLRIFPVRTFLEIILEAKGDTKKPSTSE